MNEDIIQKVMNMSPQEAWWAIAGPYSVAEVVDSIPSLESADTELAWMAGFPTFHPEDRPTPEQHEAIKALLFKHIANTYIKELQGRYESAMKEKRIR